MLATLLPGFRELRTPLAAGILWIISAWILLGDRIPTESESHGLVKRLYDLGSQVGLPAVTVGLSFTAYCLGTIVTFSTGSLFKPLESRNKVTPVVYPQLCSWAESRSPVSKAAAAGEDPDTVAQHIVDGVLKEINQLGTRLHGANVELFDDHDRLAAEADMRANVGIATVPVWISLTISV